MQIEEIATIADALGRKVVATATLAGGFSHETCLLTLTDGQVVARLGGPDPTIEAAVMAAAREHVPVPEVLLILPATTDTRPAMILDFVPGTPLSDVLAAGDGDGLDELGAELGRVVAGIGAVTFDRPGFFADASLSLPAEGWGPQLPEFAATCMAATPEPRLDQATRQAWVDLCTSHAPALARIEQQARLVHSDMNPKNILVTNAPGGWRVDAVLDWEFSYSGCPYGDAANMARFGDDYPAAFRNGFSRAFAAHHPADLPLPEDWAYLGWVLDMFALSDLATRPLGHPVAEQAAGLIRRLVAQS